MGSVRAVKNGPVTITDHIEKPLSIFAGILVVLVAVYMRQDGLSVILVAAPTMSLILLVVFRKSRALSAIILFNYPYALGAYLGAKQDIIFYPWQSVSTYEVVAIEQTSILVIAHGAALTIGLGRHLQKALINSVTAVRNFDSSLVRHKAVLAMSFAIGVHDSAFIILNLGSVLASGRHTFRDEFWVGNGPFGIVLSLSLSVCLLMTAMAKGRQRLWSIAALTCMWVPTLIAGSRNYFSVLGVAAFMVLMVVAKRWSTKWSIVLALVGVVFGLTILPTFWSENSLVGFNEWILPTSSYVPLYIGLFSFGSVGATPLFSQWPLLLPGFLRPHPVNQYAEVFAQLGVTNVGVAGNPWADSFTDSSSVRLIIFVATLFAIIYVSLLLNRFSPFTIFLCIGLLAFWGRSSFWNTLFVVIYSSVFLLVLTRRSARRVVE